MFTRSHFFFLASLVCLGAGHASPSNVPVFSRTADVCYNGESARLLCYNPPNGAPQNVTVDDVAYIASYLRAYGAQTRAGRLFNMAAADAPDCGEWSLYAHGSALALAKHIGGNTVNSSVLFADIATTIDGGAANATSTQKAAALIGCAASGGSLGVQINASNPEYNASTYPAGYTPSGILIKIVASGA